MTIKIGINGFGRIGRLVTRVCCASGGKVQVVAINGAFSTDSMMPVTFCAI